MVNSLIVTQFKEANHWDALCSEQSWRLILFYDLKELTSMFHGVSFVYLSASLPTFKAETIDGWKLTWQHQFWLTFSHPKDPTATHPLSCIFMCLIVTKTTLLYQPKFNYWSSLNTSMLLLGGLVDSWMIPTFPRKRWPWGEALKGHPRRHRFQPKTE